MELRAKGCRRCSTVHVARLLSLGHKFHVYRFLLLRKVRTWAAQTLRMLKGCNPVDYRRHRPRVMDVISLYFL